MQNHIFLVRYYMFCMKTPFILGAYSTYQKAAHAANNIPAEDGVVAEYVITRLALNKEYL